MGQILGLLGQAGSGKDTVAEIIAPVHLVEINGELVDIRARLRDRSPVRVDRNPPGKALRKRAVQIALADPLKEYALKVYDFTLEQLWGPSEARNKPDERYPRTQPEHALVDGICSRCGVNVNAKPTTYGPCTTFLTPREALQQLGTEWGRTCYPDTWVRLAIRRAELFAAKRISQPARNTSAANYMIEKSDIVVISDCRFVNEARALAESENEVWRIDRPSQKKNTAMYAHASETEQVTSADEIAQYLSTTLVNDSSIEVLRARVADELKAGGL